MYLLPAGEVAKIRSLPGVWKSAGFPLGLIEERFLNRKVLAFSVFSGDAIVLVQTMPWVTEDEEVVRWVKKEHWKDVWEGRWCSTSRRPIVCLNT